MSARVVIDNHDQLLSRGDLGHSELDQIILQGEVPESRDVKVASKVLSNTFTQDNTFQANITIEGDLIVKGETTNLDVTTLSVEDVVIYVGQGSNTPAAAGDRGVVFAVDGSGDLSFYWDNDQEDILLTFQKLAKEH